MRTARSLVVSRCGRRRIGLVLLVLLATVMTGCAGTPSPLLPMSEPAREISQLWWFIFFFAAAIFVLVEALLIYAVVRFSRNTTPGEPTQLYGNTRLEIAWTAFPAIVLTMVLALTVETMAATREPTETAFTVRVIGHQWWWEVIYPDQQIVTASELHIPAGVPIRIDLESVDVIHSFWVPQLMGKTDTVPGRVNRTWLIADEPGVYLGECTEYCGNQHANMHFYVIAHSQQDFDAWVAQNQRPTPAELLPENGGVAAAFTRCIGCHAINGSNVARGQVGPNLTNFGSRRTIAAGTLPNTPENLRRWLHSPEEVKPGNLMAQAVPTGSIPPEQIDLLVEYLLSLK